jgi:threonine synthase
LSEIKIMPTNPELICALCQNTFSLDQPIYRCPTDDYPLDVTYDYLGLSDQLSKNTFSERGWTIWRYKELLPLKSESVPVTLDEGGTPLLKSKSLARVLGLHNLFLKDETRNPTWSFKDRGSSVGVSKAIELGYQAVGCVSSGNMASSLATYAARGGIKSIVFLRKSVPVEKIIHPLVCGSRAIEVGLPYSEIYQESLKISARCGIYSVHSDAPVRVEGQKTSSLEIWEQLEHVVPDRIIIPTSSGGNMSAHWKAWHDLFELRLIDRKPSMVAIQNAAATPIYDAMKIGEEKIEQTTGEKETIATSILNSNPPSGNRVLRLLKESKGLAEEVDDTDMLSAQKVLAENEGIFAEPGACASIAGLRKLVESGEIDADELVVAVITGSGLKDSHSALRNVPSLVSISSLKELDKAVEKLLG